MTSRRIETNNDVSTNDDVSQRRSIKTRNNSETKQSVPIPAILISKHSKAVPARSVAPESHTSEARSFAKDEGHSPFVSLSRKLRARTYNVLNDPHARGSEARYLDLRNQRKIIKPLDTNDETAGSTTLHTRHGRRILPSHALRGLAPYANNHQAKPKLGHKDSSTLTISELQTATTNAHNLVSSRPDGGDSCSTSVNKSSSGTTSLLHAASMTSRSDPTGEKQLHATGGLGNGDEASKSMSLSGLQKDDTFVVMKRANRMGYPSPEHELKRKKAMVLAKANARHFLKNWSNKNHPIYGGIHGNVGRTRHQRPYIEHKGPAVQNDRGERMYFHWQVSDLKGGLSNSPLGPKAVDKLYRDSRKRARLKRSPAPSVKSAPSQKENSIVGRTSVRSKTARASTVDTDSCDDDDDEEEEEEQEKEEDDDDCEDDGIDDTKTNENSEVSHKMPHDKPSGSTLGIGKGKITPLFSRQGTLKSQASFIRDSVSQASRRTKEAFIDEEPPEINDIFKQNNQGNQGLGMRRENRTQANIHLESKKVMSKTAEPNKSLHAYAPNPKPEENRAFEFSKRVGVGGSTRMSNCSNISEGSKLEDVNGQEFSPLNSPSGTGNASHVQLETGSNPLYQAGSPRCELSVGRDQGLKAGTNEDGKVSSIAAISSGSPSASLKDTVQTLSTHEKLSGEFNNGTNQTESGQDVQQAKTENQLEPIHPAEAGKLATSPSVICSDKTNTIDQANIKDTRVDTEMKSAEPGSKDAALLSKLTLHSGNVAENTQSADHSAMKIDTVFADKGDNKESTQSQPKTNPEKLHTADSSSKMKSTGRACASDQGVTNGGNTRDILVPSMLASVAPLPDSSPPKEENLLKENKSDNLIGKRKDSQDGTAVNGGTRKYEENHSKQKSQLNKEGEEKNINEDGSNVHSDDFRNLGKDANDNEEARGLSVHEPQKEKTELQESTTAVNREVSIEKRADQRKANLPTGQTNAEMGKPDNPLTRGVGLKNIKEGDETAHETAPDGNRWPQAGKNKEKNQKNAVVTKVKYNVSSNSVNKVNTLNNRTGTNQSVQKVTLNSTVQKNSMPKPPINAPKCGNKSDGAVKGNHTLSGALVDSNKINKSIEHLNGSDVLANKVQSDPPGPLHDTARTPNSVTSENPDLVPGQRRHQLPEQAPGVAVATGRQTTRCVGERAQRQRFPVRGIREDQFRRKNQKVASLENSEKPGVKHSNGIKLDASTSKGLSSLVSSSINEFGNGKAKTLASDVRAFKNNQVKKEPKVIFFHSESKPTPPQERKKAGLVESSAIKLDKDEARKSIAGTKSGNGENAITSSTVKAGKQERLENGNGKLNMDSTHSIISKTNNSGTDNVALFSFNEKATPNQRNARENSVIKPEPDRKGRRIERKKSPTPNHGKLNKSDRRVMPKGRTEAHETGARDPGLHNETSTPGVITNQKMKEVPDRGIYLNGNGRNANDDKKVRAVHKPQLDTHKALLVGLGVSGGTQGAVGAQSFPTEPAFTTRKLSESHEKRVQNDSSQNEKIKANWHFDVNNHNHNTMNKRDSVRNNFDTKNLTTNEQNKLNTLDSLNSREKRVTKKNTLDSLNYTLITPENKEKTVIYQKPVLVRPKTAGLSGYTESLRDDQWSLDRSDVENIADDEDDRIQFIEGEQDFFEVFGYDDETAALLLATRIIPVAEPSLLQPGPKYADGMSTSRDQYASEGTPYGTARKGFANQPGLGLRTESLIEEECPKNGLHFSGDTTLVPNIKGQSFGRSFGTSGGGGGGGGGGGRGRGGHGSDSIPIEGSRMLLYPETRESEEEKKKLALGIVTGHQAVGHIRHDQTLHESNNTRNHGNHAQARRPQKDVNGLVGAKVTTTDASKKTALAGSNVNATTNTSHYTFQYNTIADNSSTNHINTTTTTTHTSNHNNKDNRSNNGVKNGTNISGAQKVIYLKRNPNANLNTSIQSMTTSTTGLTTSLTENSHVNHNIPKNIGRWNKRNAYSDANMDNLSTHFTGSYNNSHLSTNLASNMQNDYLTPSQDGYKQIYRHRQDLQYQYSNGKTSTQDGIINAMQRQEKAGPKVHRHNGNYDISSTNVITDNKNLMGNNGAVFGNPNQPGGPPHGYSRNPSVSDKPTPSKDCARNAGKFTGSASRHLFSTADNGSTQVAIAGPVGAAKPKKLKPIMHQPRLQRQHPHLTSGLYLP